MKPSKKYTAWEIQQEAFFRALKGLANDISENKQERTNRDRGLPHCFDEEQFTEDEELFLQMKAYAKKRGFIE